MKKKIAVSIVAASIILSSYSAFIPQVKASEIIASKYTDISGHWSEGAVAKLAEKSALPFNDTLYNVDKAITKGEFAYMLRRALDIQINYFKAPDIKDYFTDVDKDAPYASAVIDLVTSGVFEKGGEFKPDSTLTREEMVHYIMNAYKYRMGDKYALINIIPYQFGDNDQVTPAYSWEVARAVHYKIIQGDENNLFLPKENATRAESAVAIGNLMKVLDKQLNTSVLVKPTVKVNTDSIEMQIEIANTSDKLVTFTHSSGLKYDFVLTDSDGNELYKWSEGKAFTMMVTQSTLEPGKSIIYTEKLDGEKYKEIKDKIAYLKAYVIGSSDTFNINSEGYQISVK